MAPPKRRPVPQVGEAPIAPGTRHAERGRGLQLPHERDESADATDGQPDAVMAQAQRDIENGLVDTDLRATPGLDAAERERLLKEFETQSRDATAAPGRQRGSKRTNAPPAPSGGKKRR